MLKTKNAEDYANSDLGIECVNIVLIIINYKSKCQSNLCHTFYSFRWRSFKDLFIQPRFYSYIQNVYYRAALSTIYYLHAYHHADFLPQTLLRIAHVFSYVISMRIYAQINNIRCVTSATVHWKYNSGISILSTRVPMRSMLAFIFARVEVLSGKMARESYTIKAMVCGY